MERRILHFDMDAFYASIEMLDAPRLSGKPVVVGGSGARSVVCACSYEARRFGIHSAMPMRQAQERCPQAVCIRPRMERYREISRGIFEYLRSQTPLVEQMSVDEGYLDITDLAPSDLVALEMGRSFQETITERFGLPCSIGIAPCKFIAKIASDLRKPRALVLVRHDETFDFLTPLDVKRIPGVGRVGLRKLHASNVRTIGELRGLNREMLASMFGKWGGRLYDYARGEDARPVVTKHVRKSIGTEKTFETDVADLELLRATLRAQAEKIADGLRRREWRAQTVTVKARYANFDQVTRSESFSRPLGEAEEIASVAFELLGRTEAGVRPARLVGLTVSNFTRTVSQIQCELPLFPETGEAPL